MRPPSSEISHTLAPICGVPEESKTTPEIVPNPGFAAVEAAITRVATTTQPRVRNADFMGTGYLPVAPFVATFANIAGGVTEKSAERVTV